MQTNPLYVVAGIITIMVMLWIYALKNDIVELKEELQDISNKLVLVSSQNTICRTSLTLQNSVIKELEIDVKTKQGQIDVWKSMPPKVKYEVIYRDIIQEQNLTGGCDELKSLVNSTANINLNSL